MVGLVCWKCCSLFLVVRVVCLVNVCVVVFCVLRCVVSVFFGRVDCWLVYLLFVIVFWFFGIVVF